MASEVSTPGGCPLPRSTGSAVCGFRRGSSARSVLAVAGVRWRPDPSRRRRPVRPRRAECEPSSPRPGRSPTPGSGRLARRTWSATNCSTASETESSRSPWPPPSIFATSPEGPGRERVRRRPFSQPGRRLDHPAPCQFATAVIGVISATSPEGAKPRWGEAVGAVNSFSSPMSSARPDPRLQPPGVGTEEARGRRHRQVLLLKAEDRARPTRPRRRIWDAFASVRRRRGWSNMPTPDSFDRPARLRTSSAASAIQRQHPRGP